MAVDGRWIGGGEIESIGGRGAVVVEWGSDEWRWRSSGGVIGHGIGGKVSQLKWHDLLKASHWSKQRRSVITRSHSHSTSDGYEIQVRQRHVLCRIPYVGYPLPH